MTGSIRLQENGPWLTGLLLRFFYTHDYQIDIGDCQIDDRRYPLSAHARMYAMADKYRVPLLIDLAQEKLAPVSKGLAIAAIPYFADAIRIVFTSTLPSDRGLCNTVIPTLIALLQELRDSEDFMSLITRMDDTEFYVELMDLWGNFGKHSARCRYWGQGTPLTCNGCAAGGLSYSYHPQGVNSGKRGVVRLTLHVLELPNEECMSSHGT